ncbi:MAG TPA: histidine kinase [Vicinamibacterales bacterium]
MDGSSPALDTVSLPARKTLIRACAVATVLATIIATQVYLSMMSHGHSYLRLFTWQWGSWGFWGLVSPLVMRLGGRLTVERPLRTRAIAALLTGAALILAHSVLTAVLTVILQPFAPVVPRHSLVATFVGQSPSLFVMDTLIYSMLLIGGSAYYGYQRARQHLLRESRLEAQLARAQLEALRLEIQPHVLFNTRNSIAALIRLKDHDGALKMLLGLSDMMRSTIERPKNQLVTLSAEIEFVKRYVDLQHARFADRLHVRYEIEDRCNEVTVPTFLLQPLVENALRHGAAPRATTCHIQIGATADSGRLRLWVKDDGVGLPHDFDLARDAGTGLSNTRSRLAQLYGAAASFDVRAGDAAGTIVEIALPFSPAVETAAATP